MARDYQRLSRGRGVFVPRWMVLLGACILVFLGGLRVMIPPAWIVQRLDSPDGKRSAKLMRTQYLRQNFAIHVRENLLWHTAYYSDPLPSDFTKDLGERLLWSDDSARLYLRMGDRLVWGYDFDAGRELGREEFEAVRDGGGKGR